MADDRSVALGHGSGCFSCRPDSGWPLGSEEHSHCAGRDVCLFRRWWVKGCFELGQETQKPDDRFGRPRRATDQEVSVVSSFDKPSELSASEARLSFARGSSRGRGARCSRASGALTVEESPWSCRSRLGESCRVARQTISGFVCRGRG